MLFLPTFQYHPGIPLDGQRRIFSHTPTAIPRQYIQNTSQTRSTNVWDVSSSSKQTEQYILYHWNPLRSKYPSVALGSWKPSWCPTPRNVAICPDNINEMNAIRALWLLWCYCTNIVQVQYRPEVHSSVEMPQGYSQYLGEIEVLLDPSTVWNTTVEGFS